MKLHSLILNRFNDQSLGGYIQEGVQIKCSFSPEFIGTKEMLTQFDRTLFGNYAYSPYVFDLTDIELNKLSEELFIYLSISYKNEVFHEVSGTIDLTQLSMSVTQRFGKWEFSDHIISLTLLFKLNGFERLE